jgi:peptide deformylase
MNLVNSDHPVLRTVSKEIAANEIPELAAKSKELIDFMKMFSGIGLAANQIGDTRRYFIMGLELVINPVIINKSDEMKTDREGCLSFPKLIMPVRRHVWIEVKYLNDAGLEVVRKLKGMYARIFQHELDHLNGIVIKP